MVRSEKGKDGGQETSGFLGQAGHSFEYKSLKQTAQKFIVKPRAILADAVTSNKQVAAALHERKPLPAVTVSPADVVNTFPRFQRF